MEDIASFRGRFAPATANSSDGVISLARATPGQSISRLVVNDHVEKGGVDSQFAIVFDEAELSEFVHEMINTGSRRANSRRQYLLIDRRNNSLHLPILAKIGEMQEDASQALLTRIE